ALEVARALNEGRPLRDDTLEQLVLRRVADVDGPPRALLEKAATLGRRWPLGHLARVSTEVGGGFLEELAPLERRGIVRTLPDGERYEFSHDLVREAIYQAIPPARRRLLHRGVAEALAGELEASPGIAGTVAHHALLGENAALAVRASI